MLLSVFLYAWVCYCLCFVCLGGGGSFFSSELVCYKHVFSCTQIFVYSSQAGSSRGS
ncbi:hypothetical protein GBAR_LOCUS24887 [Geodia barretti]|uniref:Secreted protein n=1 Tax=Geodia barretti TaxID=519541 RepID=A0AA35XB49_GEOBA|nr:hypothetical protein GBAR_LOCUS24887 [Geodia barretti]